MTIDAHQHFWHYQPARDTWITDEMSVIRRDFLPEDLKPILDTHRIEGCVAVQADQSEKETEFLLQCARAHPFIKGVVGWTDLRSPQRQARLEYYSQFTELKGFRHIVQAEHEDFLLNSSFREGVQLLHDYGFRYDILIYPIHLPGAVSFARALEQPMVIDHIAKPYIKAGELEPWKKYIREIAQCDHVFCKLSGMVTEADWHHWKQDDFTIYLDTVLEAFGPGRLLYGSDWPVCMIAGGYERQFQMLQQFIAPLSPAEKRGIMGENARRFYQL